MSILNTQHILVLEENKKLRFETMPFGFCKSLKQVIHMCLLKSRFEISDIFKNIENFKNGGGLEEYLKKDIKEIGGLLDMVKEVFLILDTDEPFQQKIEEALKHSTLIEFETEQTKDGRKIEINLVESPFSTEKMMEKDLLGSYYPIIWYILQIYYLPFMKTLIMKSKLQ